MGGERVNKMRQTSIREHVHNAQVGIDSKKENIIDCTFHHIKGIGLKTETKLWQSTIITRTQFMASLPRSFKRFKKDVIDTKKLSVFEFYRGLEIREQWRIFNWPNAKIGYFDIETTGLNHFWDNITSAAVHSSIHCVVYCSANGDDTCPR